MHHWWLNSAFSDHCALDRIEGTVLNIILHVAFPTHPVRLVDAEMVN